MRRQVVRREIIARNGGLDMKKIAITGGIGSGKSTVSEIIRKMGYVVVSADKVYSELLLNEDFVKEICELMNISPIEKDGRITIDRKALSALVFSDKTQLSRLNDFTHPRIMDEIFRRSEGVEPLFFAEVPLLFERGYETEFDNVFVVRRQLDLRLSGTAKRDGKTEAEIRKVIDNQFDYEGNKSGYKSIIIENNGTIQELETEVSEAVKRLL